MAFIPPPPSSDEGLPKPLAMNERERALRDTFVAEYLIDYSATRAAMRCGFPEEFAREWAPRLMAESYVQQRIKQLEATIAADPESSKKEEDFNKQRIKAQLLREAHYHGPGSSHAARVSALKALTEIFGMEAPKKTENIHKHQGGVMRAPGIAALDSWEQSASDSQDALVRDASS